MSQIQMMRIEVLAVNETTVMLTLDLNRHRFRIPAETLKRLNNPCYIQFLVNNEDGFIALIGTDTSVRVTNKVYRIRKTKTGNSELYGRNLLAEISDIVGGLEKTHSYRLIGEVDEVNNIAYFSLNNLRKIERKRSSIINNELTHKTRLPKTNTST